MKTGLYIHVPFCVKKCAYCDFYSVRPDPETLESYGAAVLRGAEKYRSAEADTVYFGGGNPLALGAEGLSRLLGGLADIFRLDKNAEISLEANPDDVDRRAAGILALNGFNRISIGVQSLSDATLGALGRRHGSAAAAEAVLAAAEKFENVSADLMLGLWSDAAADAGRLCGLPLTHLSAYMLKIEENTPFFAMKDKLGLPDADETAEEYERVCALLAERGFGQYEISNFARPGFECRHNLKYWRLEPYIGIGPAAHSFYGGRRFFFPRSLTGFIEDPLTAVDDGEGGGPDEYLEMSLRLREGADLSRLRGYGLDPEKAGSLLSEWQKGGFCVLENGFLRLTVRGMLVSNEILARLLCVFGL